MNNGPWPKTIEGVIVADWTEFGDRFQIEKLASPRRVGAGMRTHRLWENGQPASGGQWHYSFDSARRQALYRTRSNYIQRVQFLELTVNNLERQLAEARRMARVRVPAGRRVL